MKGTLRFHVSQKRKKKSSVARVTSLVSPYAPASASIMYPSYGLPHGGVILHRGLLGALLCAALALAHERPRRLVIGHLLLRGHARNGAADRFPPKPRRRLP